VHTAGHPVVEQRSFFKRAAFLWIDFFLEPSAVWCLVEQRTARHWNFGHCPQASLRKYWLRLRSEAKACSLTDLSSMMTVVAIFAMILRYSRSRYQSI
jgi:hypothetical protein